MSPTTPPPDEDPVMVRWRAQQRRRDARNRNDPSTTAGPTGNGKNLPGPGQPSDFRAETDLPAIEPPAEAAANPQPASSCPPWCEWTDRHAYQSEVLHYSELHQGPLSLQEWEPMIGDHVPNPLLPARELPVLTGADLLVPGPTCESYQEPTWLAVFLQQDGDEPMVAIERSAYADPLAQLTLDEAWALAEALTQLVNDA